jgi:hypothetical protein
MATKEDCNTNWLTVMDDGSIPVRSILLCPECRKNRSYIDSFYQPERSKREDFCLTKLADQYIEEWEPLPFCRHAESEEFYIKGVYDFSDWLKQKMRCSEHDGNIVRDK